MVVHTCHPNTWEAKEGGSRIDWALISSETIQKTTETITGKTVEKCETLHTVGGNVNQCSYYGKYYEDSSQHWNYNTIYHIKLPYDIQAEIPLLEIYLKEMKRVHQRQIYSSTIIATPFIKAKEQK